MHEVDVALLCSDATEGNVTIPVTKILNFDSANYDDNQQVTVTGVDDSLSDGDTAYHIDLTLSSSDSEFDGKSDKAELVNIDDEVGINPGIIMYLLN